MGEEVEFNGRPVRFLLLSKLNKTNNTFTTNNNMYNFTIYFWVAGANAHPDEYGGEWLSAHGRLLNTRRYVSAC